MKHISIWHNGTTRGGLATACLALALSCSTASLCLAQSSRADQKSLDALLDSADRSMKQSADSLKDKNADDSVGQQSKAIRDMEKYLYPDPNDPSAQREGSQDTQGRQEQLKKRLEALKKKLAEMGLQQDGQKGQRGQKQPGQQGQQGQQGQDGDQDGDDGFDAAENAMGDAGNQIGEGDSDGAATSQGKAIDALRKGMQDLADSMGGQQQGEGQEPGDGEGPGQAVGRQQGNGERTDPLGRPLRGKEYSDDYTVKIPGEIDAQRARRILEELRRRLSDPARPQIELDYLERLLKDF
ncbi:DUF4175 family protein [Bradyrhizobium betae]|uniref:DUF4175 domain-containing protein n=1 Tax=Bradyrhizobium betae TaxID=244734 RepID=A0A5P6P3M8_9BRAD|nr:DUF4175 family protein [Bradyrhizobium betae]MCS3728379.1 hypothetical protein [Bradyrhizobium betae]QFI72949.1 DUF4175 domain-containing protein [Bradyrhizobium betae]